MTLSDFIHQVMLEIADGVKRAQGSVAKYGASLIPPNEPLVGVPEPINLQVAVVPGEKGTVKVGENESEAVNNLKFSLMLALPKSEKGPAVPKPSRKPPKSR